MRALDKLDDRAKEHKSVETKVARRIWAVINGNPRMPFSRITPWKNVE
jgi:hypothetical protein